MVVLTEEQVKLLRQPELDTDLMDLSRQWGVSRSLLANARYGRSYKWFNPTIPPAAPATQAEISAKAAQAARKRHEAARAKRVTTQTLSYLEKQESQCSEHDNGMYSPSIVNALYKVTVKDKTPEPDPAVQHARYAQAIRDGGHEEMYRLEQKYKDCSRLTDEEWAKLHRLRVGLIPKAYAMARNKPSKVLMRY